MQKLMAALQNVISPRFGMAISLLMVAHAPISFAVADEEAKVDWSCECLTFDGKPENCHMFANITGPVMSFGAFETSGDGPYEVERTDAETVVIGTITRIFDQKPMKVFIAEPRGGGTAKVFMDEMKPGGETFTAKCEGRLPK